LLLTPLYLKKKMVKSNIGFFIHSPFPSSDIYKTFQYRVELLKSLLCCDIIGFHLFEYARNFVASCRKILQLTSVTKKGGYMGVEYNGRTVLLKVNHIGINQEDVYKMIRSQSFFNFKYLLSQQVQYKKYIISSVDRLHPISGIKAKLEGYQMFLKSYPPYRQNTCLIQYILPESFQDKDKDPIQESLK
jgi:trehalose 6-phosphate synthase/phosphatase